MAKVYEHRESEALESACEILGVTIYSKRGERRADKDLKREVELRRMMGVRALEGPVEMGKAKYQNRAFPDDIWHVIIEYIETLGVLKLEKTCKTFYIKFNKQCKDCEQETLTLSPDCTNFWRREYVKNDMPFLINPLFDNSCCSILKALVSR